MTLDEAQLILRRRPTYVREANCDSVRQWIEQHVDPDRAAGLLPNEDAMDIAERILADLNADARRVGDPDLPVSAEELAAYLTALTAEKGGVM